MLFSYKAIDKNGKTIIGSYDASERSQVIAYLKAQNMTPMTIGNGTSTNWKDFLPKKKPKAKDLSMFCEQFYALLKAGVSTVDSLGLLLEQTKDRTLKEGVQITLVGINEGNSLADSMAQAPLAFDETLISLVRAGEKSGSLIKSLERMSAQYKKDAEIAAAIKKAMMYPAIVLVVSLIVVVFMLVYIVPSFMNMFEDVGMEMPKITLAVVAASNWLISNWFIVLAIVVLIIVSSIAFSRSPQGKKFFSKMSLKLPGVNNFVIKSNASKISRTLSTLISAGMTPVESLEILENTLKNYYYKEAIKDILESVLVGQPMSKKFFEYPNLFPSMLSHMVSVGEGTGDSETMLARTADYYDLEVETATETMMSMLQPAVIIMLTGIVGVILAAVLSPMVAMYSQLGDSL